MKNIGLIIYANGLCKCSVCVLKDATRKEVTDAVNTVNPTGLNRGWRISRKKTFKGGANNPCPCNTDPETRLHYLMEC